MKYYVIFLVLVVFSEVVNGQNGGIQLAEESITQADLKRHLSIIASDALKGRNTGSKEQLMAAEYIANHLKMSKMEGVVNSVIGKSHFQYLDLIGAQLKSMSLKSQTASFVFEDDYYGTSIYRDSGINLESAFVGYGIESESFNDYENVDLEGKVAIILWGEPENENGDYLINQSDIPSAWGGTYGWLKKSKVAKRRGAEEVIFVLEDEDYEKRLKKYSDYIYTSRFKLPDSRDFNGVSGKYGGIYFNQNKIESLCGISDKDLEKYFKSLRNNKPELPVSSGSLFIQTKYNQNIVSAPNILGLIKATEETDETVVVTAHYDHIGFDSEGIYNGADDNGSGTVSVLEIVEAFSIAKANGIELNKNILFMWFTGEEKGLLGSRYFCDFNPAIPLENIVCNVNIDMVGRVDDDHEENRDYVYSIGSDRLSSELKSLCEKVNKEVSDIEIDYSYDALDDPNNFYKRSDHYNFAKNDIPVVFYFNGTHDDYHQTTDTVEKIQFDVMEKRVRMIFRTILEIAQMEGRFELDNKDSDSSN